MERSEDWTNTFITSVLFIFDTFGVGAGVPNPSKSPWILPARMPALQTTDRDVHHRYFRLIPKLR